MEDAGLFFKCWVPAAGDVLQDTEAYETENVSHCHSSCQHHLAPGIIQQGDVEPTNVVPSPTESEEDSEKEGQASEEVEENVNLGTSLSVKSSLNNEINQQPAKDSIADGDEAINSLSIVKLSTENLHTCQFATIDKDILNPQQSHNQPYLPHWAKTNKCMGPSLLESLDYLQTEYPARYKSLQEMAPKRKYSGNRLYMNAEKRRRKALFSPPFLPD